MSEQFWYLKSCSLIEQLAPEDVALLESRARSRNFERTQSNYVPQEQSDSLLVVASGRVKLYHITPDGKESLLALIDRAEVFGELAVLDESSHGRGSPAGRRFRACCGETGLARTAIAGYEDTIVVSAILIAPPG